MQEIHVIEYFALARNNKLKARIATWVEFKGPRKVRNRMNFRASHCLHEWKIHVQKYTFYKSPNKMIELKHIRNLI